MREVLGKKNSDRLEKLLKIQVQEKVNEPLKNSILVKTLPDGQNIYELQTQPVLDLPEDDICNVLVVGMTGVGKSTFLNSLVNELAGVQMTDNFRYIIIDDMLKNKDSYTSSTSSVNIYGIPKMGKMKKAMRLIDAPGLGDTGGIKKDKENIEKIKKKI